MKLNFDEGKRVSESRQYKQQNMMMSKRDTLNETVYEHKSQNILKQIKRHILITKLRLGLDFSFCRPCSAALSMNYVDASNLWMYLFALVSDNDWKTVEMFDVVKRPFGLKRRQEDMPYSEWKSSRARWAGLVDQYRRKSPRYERERVPVWLDDE